MTPCMTPFDVVLVPFPFTDLGSVKRRPCLVLATAEPAGLPAHLLVAMMTSHMDRRFPHDVELADPAAAGLPKATLVRLFKLVTLDATLKPRRLGRLAASDRARVVRALGTLLARLTQDAAG